MTNDMTPPNHSMTSPLKSMTGFARSDGRQGQLSWVWEIRSVNGRSLDLRTRLAPGFEAIEPRIKELAGKRLQRGNLQVNLTVNRDAGTSEIRLNEAVLAQILAAAAQIQALTGPGAAPLSVDALLSQRGVLEVRDVTENDAVNAAAYDGIVASFDGCLDALVAARASEGGRLAVVMADQLAEIERIVATVKASPARTPETIKARLAEQVGKLLEASTTFDAARLHQEAVLLATRADVEEELQRLTAHIAAARDLLALNEPVGRKFDFLTQEFNREANTLCAKSNDTEITRLGLTLKTIIDQMREQVANIE
jgi:uncharacterized protein (TIGR00255 family)